MTAPLLSPEQSARAVAWNRQRHPAQSGVDPAAIRTRLGQYVNLAGIESAIRFRNQLHPSAAPIQAGSPPIDAVFVEAVHQFQAKCFLERSQIDGLAGEATLDSLGFVKRKGLRSVAQPHAGAVKQLRRKKIERLTGGEFTAADWFEHMMNPSFLGWRFKSGVHLVFVRKLRLAERWLLSLPRYRGKTPAELGRALGFDETNEEHKGGRPHTSSASMHTFGLAADVRYTGNPWIKDEPFTSAFKRSALLMSGAAIPYRTVQAYLHSLGADPRETTGSIYRTLHSRDAAFRAYLRLSDDLPGLQRVLEQRRAAGTAGVFASSGETNAAAATRWQRTIRKDLADLRGKGSPFLPGGRDPRNGFLNLAEDLVVALRDRACMAWGAVDFGPKASGDVMHFDLRVCGVGRQLLSDQGYRPTTGHPCVDCLEDAAARETETYAEAPLLDAEVYEVFGEPGAEEECEAPEHEAGFDLQLAAPDDADGDEPTHSSHSPPDDTPDEETPAGGTTL